MNLLTCGLSGYVSEFTFSQDCILCLGCILHACNGFLTVGAGAAQNLYNILVGGVLAQSAHDVGHLIVGHLAVTNSVKETKSLLEVWTGRERVGRQL